MRSYGIYDVSRGLTLAFAAGLVGLALWGATQVGTYTTGRFWVAMVIVGAAGFLFALANHVGTWTKGLRLRLSPGTFLLAFLPVLVVVGWILISTQPGNGWQEGRLDSWSNSMGILGAVHAISLWHGVLAFGFGLVLGLCFDGVPAEAVEPVPAYGPGRAAVPPAGDEPMTAERRRVGGTMAPARPVREVETTETRERTRTR
jgi:hypothetical protein